MLNTTREEKDILVSHNIAIAFFIDALTGDLPFGVMNLLRLANMDLLFLSLGYCILTYSFSCYPTTNTDNLHATIHRLTQKVSDNISIHLDRCSNNNNIMSRLLNNGIQKVSCKKSHLDKGDIARMVTSILTYLTQTNKEILYCYFNLNMGPSIYYVIKNVDIFSHLSSSP